MYETPIQRHAREIEQHPRSEQSVRVALRKVPSVPNLSDDDIDKARAAHRRIKTLEAQLLLEIQAWNYNHDWKPISVQEFRDAMSDVIPSAGSVEETLRRGE